MKHTAKFRTPAKFSELPKSYGALCAILMPRTIHDDNTAKALKIAPESLI